MLKSKLNWKSAPIPAESGIPKWKDYCIWCAKKANLELFYVVHQTAPLKSKMHPPLNRNCTPYTVSIKITVLCHNWTPVLMQWALSWCPFFVLRQKLRGSQNEKWINSKDGAGDKSAPNVCCRTPMESAPPVFFCQKGGSCRMQNGYHPGFRWIAGRAGWLHCLPFDVWIEKRITIFF